MSNRAQRALIVVAEPADAIVLAGGVIATLTAGGGDVTVVSCLETRDEADVSRALAGLGVRDHRVLGHADARRTGLAPRRYVATAVNETPFGREPASEADDDALCRADAGEVAADVATVVLDVRPDVVLGYDEWGGDRHPDRIRVYEAARRAAEVMGVPYYAADGADSGRAPTLRLEPQPDAAERKDAALAAVGRPSTRAIERFTRLRRHPAPERTRLSSLLAGALVAFLAGAGVGALGTISHQFSPPWGIALALLAVAGLVVGLRVVFGTRTMSFAATVGVLGAAALFTLPGGGGSVLVPGNELGYVWTFGPVLIALLALGWPRIPQRPTP